VDDLESLAARYHAGEEISFGPGVVLANGILCLSGQHLPLNTLDKLRLDADGNVLIRHLGRDQVPFAVPAVQFEDADWFVRVTNHLLDAIPYVARRSTSGWPPGSIGDISSRIDTDVRELLIVGYTNDQIRGLLRREYTLEELSKQRPKGKPMTLRKGKRKR
jgi:hypothetical protein